ncbi:MAG TPA: Ig-like domain-containing protein [Fibrobacteria bacterium]|nr:Ig-like domain-containing protein [Fibrobacteria bacterium]
MPCRNVTEPSFSESLPRRSLRNPVTRDAGTLRAARIAAALALSAVAALAQVNVKIDFEPIGASTPLGYLKDVGAPYDDAAGSGWITEASVPLAAHAPLDLRAYTRDRARAGIDPRQNTLIHMQYPAAGMNGAFEYAVPNGSYKVVVSVGDQPPYNSSHTIRAEGATVISAFVGTAAKEFKVDSVTVTVSDGRLTVDAIGGTNTKLNYLRIAAAGLPPEPAPVDLKINFQNASAVPPAGYLRDYGQAFGLRTGANQGTGLSYGWVVPGTTTPRDLSIGGSGPGNGRNRGTPAEVRIATLMHMQGDQVANFNGTPLPGSWEIAVPDNWYTVTVAVGDPSNLDGRHVILIEGQAAVNGFVPTAANPLFAATKVVQVTDGRLTLAATGGTNTKVSYVLIQSGIPTAGRPSVSTSSPLNGAVNVARDAAFTAEVLLPHGAINANTLRDPSVQLFRSADNLKIPVQVNTSGGGDVIVLQPSQILEAGKGYRVEISQSVQDETGRAFLPFSSAFTTGADIATQPTVERFDPVSLGAVASGRMFTSVVMGPDGRLYASTLTGEILRYPFNADGTLGTPLVITSVQAYNGNTNRAIIGMAFDPLSTPAAPILWITNNAPTLANSVDWSGKITRLSGPDLGTVQDYVVGLPRAIKDHMTNSLAFGPDGALYVMQGSRSANGGRDSTWKGDERLLSAAVLRVDRNAISAPPALNVKTEEDHFYDPYAPGAAVTLYATGVRNAYDLVWHSNGSLYSAGNSSAAGGSTPTTPPVLPAICQDRADKAVYGPYTGPMVTGFSDNIEAQPDFLYRLLPGKYYGHPNPKRCEWVLNGGNPTSGADFLEEKKYAVGVEPDRNWQRPEYVLGLHFSPDGLIEYKSNAFGGSLRTRLMVARYSVGKDILVLTVDNATKKITSTQPLNVGGVKFADPLDLAENPANGYLYVVEYAGKKLTLLRPR